MKTLSLTSAGTAITLYLSTSYGKLMTKSHFERIDIPQKLEVRQVPGVVASSEFLRRGFQGCRSSSVSRVLLSLTHQTQLSLLGHGSTSMVANYLSRALAAHNIPIVRHA